MHPRQLQAVTVKILLKYLDVMDASMPALDSQNPFEILSRCRRRIHASFW